MMIVFAQLDNLNLTESTMHRVFGIKENTEYFDREGVYLIPYRNKQIGVIQTPKGYFWIRKQRKPFRMP